MLTIFLAAHIKGVAQCELQVKEYHKKGVELTATDSNGWTPLHHAARLEKTQVVQYIVDNGGTLYMTLCTYVLSLSYSC